jgi:uncharacterized protein (DUF1697 family)
VYTRSMARFVALLRAINVGGTGKLSMTDLRTLCEAAGFRNVRTYIQSGNVVFTTSLAETKVKAILERALAAKVGKRVGVLLRSGAELGALHRANPFPGIVPARVIVLFLDDAPPKEALAKLDLPGPEEVRQHGRDLFIHYPNGQGRSKLKLPFFQTGTARNLNTVVKLAALALETEAG